MRSKKGIIPLLILFLLNTLSLYGGVGPYFPNEVPIDGGLGALLIAGGALGYKAYKENKKRD